MSDIERHTNPGLAKLLNALGVGASVAAATTGSPGLGVSAAVLDAVLEAAISRRDDKRFRRLEAIVNRLSNRLSNLEQVTEDPEQLDLFSECLLAAAQSEGEDKTVYHTAFLAYILESPMTPSNTRLVGEAIRGLTVTELDAWAKFAPNPNSARVVNKPEWRELTIRWQAAGIYASSAVVSPSNVLPIGHHLANVLKLVESE